MNVTCFPSHAHGPCSGSNPETVVLRNATAGVNFGALGAKMHVWSKKVDPGPGNHDLTEIYMIFCEFMYFYHKSNL